MLWKEADAAPAAWLEEAAKGTELTQRPEGENGKAPSFYGNLDAPLTTGNMLLGYRLPVKVHKGEPQAFPICLLKRMAKRMNKNLI